MRKVQHGNTGALRCLNFLASSNSELEILRLLPYYFSCLLLLIVLCVEIPSCLDVGARTRRERLITWENIGIQETSNKRCMCVCVESSSKQCIFSWFPTMFVVYISFRNARRVPNEECSQLRLGECNVRGWHLHTYELCFFYLENLKRGHASGQRSRTWGMLNIIHSMAFHGISMEFQWCSTAFYCRSWFKSNCFWPKSSDWNNFPGFNVNFKSNPKLCKEIKTVSQHFTTISTYFYFGLAIPRGKCFVPQPLLRCKSSVQT